MKKMWYFINDYTDLLRIHVAKMILKIPCFGCVSAVKMKLRAVAWFGDISI